MKKMEREKLAREMVFSRMRKRNRLFLFGGLATVFGICKLIDFVTWNGLSLAVIKSLENVLNFRAQAKNLPANRRVLPRLAQISTR